jgi:trehalose synthase
MRLSDYEPVVGRAVLQELEILASRIGPKRFLNVNSTFTGGGVAEILERVVPLLNELGIDAGWRIIDGNPRFFDVTKRMHNALHGRSETFRDEDFAVYMETSNLHLRDLDVGGDLVVIHDPQPAALVRKRSSGAGRWVWRCHIDLSSPDPRVWEFLRPFVERYDAALFSAPQFSRGLPIRQFLVAPSIDPLSDKNRELSRSAIDDVLARYGIRSDKPMVTQISRFDRLKDPVGLIDAFRIVRRSHDCQLVLAGGTATDDPEGARVLEEVRERASGDPDIHILLLPPNANVEVNALQRASTIVVQKSLREGFALTVSEALWKEKPVVATAVGGIPLQVKNRITGLLSHGIEGAAYDIRQLLGNPEFARRLGQNGKEHVRQNFLVTRHVRDYLLLYLALSHEGNIVRIERDEPARRS